MAKVVIMGFVGCGNTGDEAILAGTLQELRIRGSRDVKVFSWNPDDTAERHGVDSFPVLPGLGGLRDFAARLSRGDLFLLGGGSLLQDGERRIVPFWLSRALVARLRGCRVVFHAQGVGPLNTRVARILTGLLLPLCADLVTLRDPESFAHVPAFLKPRLVADAALLLPPMQTEKVPGRIVVALRRIPAMEDMEKDLAACLAHFAKRNRLELVYVPFQYPEDCAISEKMAKLSGGRALCDPLNLDQIRQLLGSADLVVSMRLHSAILAAGLGTPVVGLTYDPKVSSFFAQLGMSPAQCTWSEEFRYQRLLDILHREYHSREVQEARLADAIPVLRERAANSVRLALELWEQRR
ncbi:MAG TPA: polysaccharide pyruvyl transferase family protein [Bacillota bacterium]|nr:polysaccharide pyruvyl transferase family protein [Bacillota bacterium]